MQRALVATFNHAGRTLEMKPRRSQDRATSIAASTSVASADVLINLVDVAKENGSFGLGLAPDATVAPV